MTVAEYELTFIQLTVYATNLVATEEEKYLKFEEGLTCDIHNKLTLTTLRPFLGKLRQQSEQKSC